MKYILNKKIETVYFCLYLSLILGLFLNEDFAFGYIQDYLLHKKTLHIFHSLSNSLFVFNKSNSYKTLSFITKSNSGRYCDIRFF